MTEIFEEYVAFGNKMLRKGYTTGTCAAAAAQAAACLLVTGEKPAQVEVELPQGRHITLPLARCEYTAEGAMAAVTKDGGDDPDITSGLNICAEVRLTEGGEITITGGSGVGKVTLAGLKVPVGQAAINPTPRAMITQNLRRVLPAGQGATVVISVPGGTEIAKRTFNPRLGIVGGISILGSTGIVNPMSEEALKQSLKVELSVLLHRLPEDMPIIFAFGNYGLDFLASCGIAAENVLKISNYLGFMLDTAREMNVKRLLLCGHLGKLVKVSGSIFHTHSHVADARLEILTAYAALAGGDAQLLRRIYAAKTTSAAAAEIDAAGLAGVYRMVTENAARRSETYTYNEITVGAMLFGYANRLLYMEEKARQMLTEIKQKSRKADDL